ncbi:hypothetical protein BJ546DRAFT_283004 [Cryomyces antarcticus]
MPAHKQRGLSLQFTSGRVVAIFSSHCKTTELPIHAPRPPSLSPVRNTNASTFKHRSETRHEVARPHQTPEPRTPAYKLTCKQSVQKSGRIQQRTKRLLPALPSIRLNLQKSKGTSHSLALPFACRCFQLPCPTCPTPISHIANSPSPTPYPAANTNAAPLPLCDVAC